MVAEGEGSYYADAEGVVQRGGHVLQGGRGEGKGLN